MHGHAPRNAKSHSKALLSLGHKMQDPSSSELVEMLRANAWFKNAGSSIETLGHKRVESWDQAFMYASHDVTKWATIEAANVLYKRLSTTDYNRFKEWNAIASGLGSTVTELVQAATAASEVTIPPSSQEWLHAVIIGALMEDEFKDCAQVSLFRDLAMIMLSGYFPCGWYCRSAEDFPHNAPILVY